MLLIEDTGTDVIFTLNSVAQLSLHEEIVNGDAVIMTIVLHILPCLFDTLIVVWHL